MRDEVLETGKYPDILYDTKVEATEAPDGLYQAKIWGDLALRGVTRAFSSTRIDL